MIFLLLSVLNSWNPELIPVMLIVLIPAKTSNLFLCNLISFGFIIFTKYFELSINPGTTVFPFEW